MTSTYFAQKAREAFIVAWGSVVAFGLSGGARADSFLVQDLVVDDSSVGASMIIDPNLKNAWGISFIPTGPFWVSANGTGLSTLYSVNPLTNATTKLGLEVSIPGDGSVTGQAANVGTGFGGDRFLFVSEDGTISGWRGALGTTAEVLQTGLPANIYKGTALADVGSHSYLYSANFGTGAIDVLKGDAGAPTLAGTFTDPGLPAGYAPFNIQNIDGKLYVSYAVQGGKDEVAGPGLGIVSVFDTDGNFLQRLTTGGTLNAPWGMAVAPSSFGRFAGDLLVGNFGDGTINAFNLTTGVFDGQLNGPGGAPLVIDGLWGLTIGNGTSAGSLDRIYFSAGPNDEANGAFGVITFVPEPGSVVLGLIALTVFGGVSRLRARR